MSNLLTPAQEAAHQADVDEMFDEAAQEFADEGLWVERPAA